MTAALTWHDEGEILGVRVRVHLFDAAAAEAKAAANAATAASDKSDRMFQKSLRK